MKATELRIGNLVRHSKDKSINVVQFLSPFNEGFANTTILTNSYFPPFTIESAEPIPLTEEWLLKFGFEKVVYDSEETGYGTDYELEINEVGFLSYSDDFSCALFSRYISDKI